MKTTTLFLIILIPSIALLSILFFLVPTYATQVSSFLFSIPARFESVAAWATTNLSTIIATGTATAVPIMYGANWLYKRASENKENQVKARVAEAEAKLLSQNKELLNLKSQAQAKDTVITQLQAGQASVADLQSKVEALETQNLTLATERNQANQLLKEKYLQQVPEPKVP